MDRPVRQGRMLDEESLRGVIRYAGFVGSMWAGIFLAALFIG